MTSRKRQHFLSSFFSALGAKKLRLNNIFANYIGGTVSFSSGDRADRQDFHWEMTEREAPGSKLLYLMKFLQSENLLRSGRLIRSAAEIKVPELDKQQKEKVFEELFQVRVRIRPGRDLALKPAAPDL